MKYFSLNELLKSKTADRLGISNNPSPVDVNNLIKLVDRVLDPLREAYDKPIQVNSGYRSYALNKAVGGVSTSQHTKGMAADITGGNKAENRKLYELAQELKLPFCQLINEKNYTWIHISYDEDRVKRQVL